MVAPFLNEAAFLDRFLRSLAAQRRLPDVLLLVDDGSTDGSREIAERFAAEHPWARVLRRPPRPKERDRLAAAAEYQAFQWAVDQLDAYDVVGKLDTDLDLSPGLLEALERALESEPRLGIVGSYLSIEGRRGVPVRERCPAYHVRGATKFYRRACLEQISPIAPILGWDTIDETKARMLGWATRSLALPEGDSLHLRPTGHADGALRGARRRGACAFAAGAHPVWVVLGGVARFRERPYGLVGAHYVAGCAGAALRRLPRAEREVRRHARREQLRRLRGRLGSGPRLHPAAG